MLKLTVLTALFAVFQLTTVHAAAAGKQDFDYEALFRASCAPCHGVAGAGDGPVAPVLASRVPRLDDLAKRYGGAFPEDYVREAIDGRADVPSHGDRQMPVWGMRFSLRHADAKSGKLGHEETAEASARHIIDGLVGYIRQLQSK